jgi:hypothetical protein
MSGGYYGGAESAKYGAGMLKIKEFYGKNRIAIMTVGAVAAVAAVGYGGMAWYKRMKEKEQAQM